MNVVGIDPSSTKIGVAVFVDNEFKFATTYTVDKSRELPDNLLDFCKWLQFEVLLLLPPPSVIVIETAHSRIRNINTFKKISYFESAAMIGASAFGPVQLLGVSTARKLAFGNGHLSKDETGALVEEREPGYKWGSPDEKDAYCLALAMINDVK